MFIIYPKLNDTISSLKSDRVLLASSNTSSDSIMFGVSSGVYGYIAPCADTVVPFKKEITVTYITEAQSIATAIIGEYYMCVITSVWAGGGPPTDLIFTGANVIFYSFPPQFKIAGGMLIGSVDIIKATATSVSIASSSKSTFTAASWYKLDY